MATAERAKREKVVTTTITEDVIRLELTEAEAETVLAVLGVVGGNPELSHRGTIKPVFEALEGFFPDYWLQPISNSLKGFITFEDVK